MRRLSLALSRTVTWRPLESGDCSSGAARRRVLSQLCATILSEFDTRRCEAVPPERNSRDPTVGSDTGFLTSRDDRGTLSGDVALDIKTVQDVFKEVWRCSTKSIFPSPRNR